MTLKYKQNGVFQETDTLNMFKDSLIVSLPASRVADESLSDTPSDEAANMSVTDTVTSSVRTSLAEGAAILAAHPLWWNAPTYSGSGNLLNSGTLGSSGGTYDMVLGAATAAPTFSTDHFVLDGVNDFMAMAINSQLNFANRESLTLWIVCTPITTYTTSAYIFGWQPSLGLVPGASIGVDFSLNTTINWSVRSNGSSAGSTTSAIAASKRMLVVQRNISTGQIIGGNVTSTTANLVGTPTSSPGDADAMNGSSALTIGSRPGGAASWMHMSVYAAGLDHRAYSPSSLMAIAASYGL